ncbi:DNA/RNA helicase domain-containing protein [Amycolatopsis rhabdoformis]|uniref:DNA/RNA helicase domain-containing protein n=1 Tax=Amycolatopsis rhabdoformis TaxID=1448059 RepID=A0ABZ1HZ21_9PSEU|nr:DNA/RNA helicase domain-containing protein [Amycolatopsis rhabdoformis]WSE27402.1 DNA/RNA helicase domain-containing protein [Amycolatopsis rhabdoformis]
MPYSRGVNTGQLGAWRNSLPALFDLLVGIGLGHLQVILEFGLPYSPMRVDAVLCGIAPDSGRRSYAFVELKQWSRPKLVAPGLVDPIPGRDRSRAWQPELHPAEQVRRYCQYALDFTPSLARTPDAVKGLAYLHNANRTESWTLDDFDFDDFGQLYTKDQLGDLVSDLYSLFDDDPATESAAREAGGWLDEAKKTPGGSFLKTAAAALAGREGFLLLDAQKVAYDLVLQAVERADRSGSGGAWNKTVVVVRGGPGSGKSAIAVALMSALAGRQGKVLHATGSKAFTETLRKAVIGGGPRAGELFKYFNDFRGWTRDALDVLVCDEAHRIRDDVPRDRWNKWPPQVARLIDVAKVPVFLLDDHQAVRPRESQTAQQIVEVAHDRGCHVEEIRLDGQFRCGGSRHFDEWVLRLLGIADGAPVRWSDLVDGTDDEYVVSSAVSPDALENWLLRQSRAFGGTARIAAGFCWDWSDPVRKDGKYQPVVDVQIGGWRRPWNIKQGREAEGYPSASYWATDPAGWGQVGCIYTAQGFEYDWAGVIFGEDLVVRDGRWVARRDKSRDTSVNGTQSEEFDRLVRNTYKVLMTRGLQGTCLCSVDPETAEFLLKYSG